MAGYSEQSTGWEAVTFQGVIEDHEGFVIEIADDGAGGGGGTTEGAMFFGPLF